jgi:uncharacterized protein with GYD domain
MPKYLLQINYVNEGIKGLLKDGGTTRRAAADRAAASVGGTLEAMYYAFGDTDCFVVAEVPDQASAVALSLTLKASGAVTVRTTPLMAVEDIDAATKKSPSYQPPGR